MVGYGLVNRCWDTMVQETTISHQNTATLYFNIVLTMWPNVCNYGICVP